ncbi:MAG: radical SAM protein [Oscillospiraceae bacterium]|nr:radical SAM protein [Oscillospiraceae bacterium]
MNNNFASFKKQLLKDAKIQKQFIACQFELTPRCNLDCKMCYVHNQDSNKLKALELSTEQWKSIFDQACDNGLMFAVLTGGECLLREDFKELYLHLVNRGVFVSIISNGALLNEDYIEFFKQYPPDTINISLYGSDDDHYRSLTGHAKFTQVTDAIRRVREAGLNLDINVTASGYMLEDYINILKYLKDNHLPNGIKEFLMFEKRYDPDTDEHFLSSDDIVRLSTERHQLYWKSSPVPEDELPPVGGCLKEVTPTGINCSAGTCKAHISWEGVMYPCISLYEYGGYSLKEMSFKEAWEKTVAAMEKVCDPVECQGCAYKKACPKCIYMRSDGIYSGHCNPRVCEYTKRLVAAGVCKLDQAQGSIEDEFEH